MITYVVWSRILDGEILLETTDLCTAHALFEEGYEVTSISAK